MTTLPYVLVVLFSLGDGSALTMQTSQSFVSPLNCSMRAFIENEKDRQPRRGTYVCMTRARAASLLSDRRHKPVAPAPETLAQDQHTPSATPQP